MISLVSEGVNREVAQTRGADELGLVTSPAQERLRRWNDLIDLLLSWRSNRDTLDYPEIPRVAVDRLESAIDLAYDRRAAGAPVPSAAAPSVDGGISFEWRLGDALEEWSGQAPGDWEVTVIRSGKPVEHYLVRRDPLTRRLEIASS